MAIGDIHNVEDNKATLKFNLVRLKLDQGGYTSNGMYYGTGMPLWHYYYDGDKGMIDGVFRAPNRECAKDSIRDMYPNAKFYR